MLPALLILSFVPMAAALGSVQAVGVRGVLICHDKPAAGVQVKLYDEDKLSPDEFMAGGKTDSSGHFEISGHASEFTSIEPKLNIYHDCDDGIMVLIRRNKFLVSPDEFMAGGKTDSSGHFEISGHASEFTSIEPKLNIYHDCDDGIKPCQRKLSIHIPGDYISSGEVAKKFFDFGTFQLAGKYAGETRDCIHRV
ncbi:Transthyretin-like family protein [Cooperia oncophora]